MLFIIIGLVIFIIFGIVFFFLFMKKPKAQAKEEVKVEIKKVEPKAILDSDKAEIHIIVDQPQKTKEKTTDPEEIKKEAEAIGKMLITKNPNSPMPYKTLGDFYLSKGLKNEAIQKYIESLAFINKNIPYEKVKSIEDFLRSQNYIKEANSIKSIYTA